MSQIDLRIEARDPLSSEALFLLNEAAWEARQLYSDLIDPAAPMPTNQPLQAGGVYFIAFLAGNPVGCGALRTIGDSTAEIRRMYVLRSARRTGVARTILGHLEEEASRLGYQTLMLETGSRQLPAMALYESCGFTRIPPFGSYLDDPTSVCYAKKVAPRNSRQPVQAGSPSRVTPL
jgi:GNAT superfamily N-acetyltransferase